MGHNQSAALKSINNSNSSQKSHLKKPSKSSTKKLNSGDNFIIKFHKTYGGNELDEAVLSDKRRIVFISLIGLFKSYKQCPSHILYTCLLLLPLKRKWIYNPNRYQRELQQQFNGMADDIFNKNDKYSKEKRMDFIRLLQWKDRQGFAFWMLDGNEYEKSMSKLKSKSKKNGECSTQNKESDENEMVAPFWKYFSYKLSSIHDPVTDAKYNPLILSESYWKDTFDAEMSKFKTSRKCMFMELYILTMKYASIQQLIYESNPESLNPIITYDKLSSYNDDDSESKNDTTKTVEEDGFWISADYECDSSHGDIDYIHEEVTHDIEEDEEEEDEEEKDDNVENMESYVISEGPLSPEGVEDLSFKSDGDESPKVDDQPQSKSKSNSRSQSN